MLRSIQLDDQHFFSADEIGDVSAKWDLSTEFETVQPAALEFIPEAVFGVGLPAAEFSGLRGFAWQRLSNLFRATT